MKSIAKLVFLALLASCMALHSQEVKSARASLKISNIPKPESEAALDTDPPVLEYISPKIPAGFPFNSPEPSVDLVARTSDDSGISFVSVNSELQSLTETGIFTLHLDLQAGENRYRIMAMDKEENMLEKVLVVNYIPQVLSLEEQINRESTYYGLFIGINQYQDQGITDLDRPIEDAKELYNTLVENYQFEKENIRFLKDATREDLIRSLDEMSGLVGPADNLLIFYAGHGWWDAEANNGYWLPSDANSEVKTNWFRNSTLVDYLREIDSRHTLLITDACFGGSIFKTRSAFGSKEKAFEKLYELPSRKAMTSGNLSEVPDQSPFTSYLVERLKENQKTYISSEQLFSSFRMAVINNSDAIPMYGEIEKVGDEGGDFIFLKKK